MQIYRTEPVSGGNSTPARAEILFGAVNRPKNTRGYQEMCGVGTKKCVEWGFGYGESEYEVSFGLAPQNEELSPPDPQTQEPFNSPIRARNPERTSDSISPQSLGSVGQNLGSRDIQYIPRDKKAKVKLTFFLKMANGEICIFFDFSVVK